MTTSEHDAVLWFRSLTWTCHACGDERPDDKISVASATFPIRGGACGQVNRRFCNDRSECAVTAASMAEESARRMTIV